MQLADLDEHNFKNVYISSVVTLKNSSGSINGVMNTGEDCTVIIKDGANTVKSMQCIGSQFFDVDANCSNSVVVEVTGSKPNLTFYWV